MNTAKTTIRGVRQQLFGKEIADLMDLGPTDEVFDPELCDEI
jgi:hypothetical protein